MKNIDVVRAWRDERYRMSLSEEERSQLPAHPAGLVCLEDEDLAAVTGGDGRTWYVWTAGCCRTDDWGTLACCGKTDPVPMRL